MRKSIANSQRHIPALDGIRGIAIFGTLGIHIAYLDAMPKAPPAYLHLFHVIQLGWMGVDLFLVLSGFLITGILLDSKTASNFFRAFYARRTLRIFPIYYGVLLGLLAVSPWLRHTSFSDLLPDHSAWLPHFLYLQNWFAPRHPAVWLGVLGPLWTLAIEEQFYLVWPLLVYLLPRRAFIVMCAMICALVPVWRAWVLVHHPEQTFLLENTFARFDTLTWGAVAALIVRTPELLQRLRRTLPWCFVVCAAAMLVIDYPLHELYSRSRYTQSIGFTLIAVGSAALLLLAYISDSERGRLAHVLSWGWLRSLGRYSYGMYVLQGFILLPASHYLPHFAWFGKSITIAFPVENAILLACWALAWCSFHLYERRFLHFKKFFVPQRSDRPDIAGIDVSAVSATKTP